MAKSMKEPPKRLLMVIPEWQKRSFFEMLMSFRRWGGNWIPSLVCLDGFVHSEGSEGCFQARKLDEKNDLRC